ncbi:MAG: hypothetical protein Q8N56_02715 [bacterium]|nr:hypothetical protein [bacterium]
MTKQIRTILFYGCLAIFIIIAPLVVFYAQGYRIDFENRRITKTGAFYFRISPKNSDIFLDGKLVKKNQSFFLNSILIENLLPGNYTVEIKKQDYSLWKKTLEIKAMEATEVKNILLFPQNSHSELIAKNVNDFFPAPDGKKIVLQKNDSQGYYLTIFEPESNLETIAVKEKDILKTGNSFLNLSWLADSQRFILETAISEQRKFFLVETTKIPIKSTSLNISPDSERIESDQKNPDQLFVLEADKLSLNNLTAKTSREIAKSVVAFAQFNDSVYLLQNNGFVSIVKNYDITNATRLNEAPLIIEKETYYNLIPTKAGVFLEKGEALLFFDKGKAIFTGIATEINDFQISPDNQKIAYFNGGEISIYYLEERREQPQKKSGEKTFLIKLPGNINQLFWLNNDYLITATEDGLMALEIDERDQPNSVILARLKNPKLFFDKNTEKTSVLTEGNFLTYPTILP